MQLVTALLSLLIAMGIVLLAATYWHIFKYVTYISVWLVLATVASLVAWLYLLSQTNDVTGSSFTAIGVFVIVVLYSYNVWVDWHQSK